MSCGIAASLPNSASSVDTSTRGRHYRPMTRPAAASAAIRASPHQGADPDEPLAEAVFRSLLGRIYDGRLAAGALINEAGNNVIEGPVTLSSGAGGSRFTVSGGSLVINGFII